MQATNMGTLKMDGARHTRIPWLTQSSCEQEGHIPLSLHRESADSKVSFEKHASRRDQNRNLTHRAFSKSGCRLPVPILTPFEKSAGIEFLPPCPGACEAHNMIS